MRVSCELISREPISGELISRELISREPRWTPSPELAERTVRFSRLECRLLATAHSSLPGDDLVGPMAEGNAAPAFPSHRCRWSFHHASHRLGPAGPREPS